MAAPGGSPARLRAPAHQVSRRAIAWWTVRSAVGTLVLLCAQIVAGVVLAVGGADLVLVGSVIGATLVLGVIHMLVVPRWRYRLHRWEAGDDAVHTLAGWLRLDWRIAPISRIQTVDTERGPLQRLFGLSTVTVTTASASGALRLEGLDADEAAELAHRLTEATEAVGGDAT